MTYSEAALTTLRRTFHQAPELGFQEAETKRRIATILRDLGLEVHEGVGVVGVLRAGSSPRMIGLRADMDALPIHETSTHGYRSNRAGVMHACGHDGHMTILLAAADQLSSQPDFDGTVVFIFQPNEENGLGAQAMIDEGLLEQFPLEEVYALHNLPGAPLGEVSTRVGQICASESLFEIKIMGRGGHASMPHVGVEALTIGAEIVLALQTVVARKLAPDAGAVLSVTEFITDGQRNVLPGTVTLRGDLRTRAPADCIAAERFIGQIIQGIASAHGAEATLTFKTEFVETFNAESPVQTVVAAARALGLPTLSNRPPMSFSEDFAHFAARKPGCFFLLGNGTQGPHGQPLHSSDYDFNDDLIAIGARLWARIVRDRMSS